MNSTVLGIRIPKRLKEELERLKINYSEEVRKYLERRVREEIARIERVALMRDGIVLLWEEALRAWISGRGGGSI